MTVRRSKMVVATVALAALLAGCGSDDDDAGSSPQATTATTTATSGLVGEYRRTLTAADVERTEDARLEAGPTQERPEPGPLALRLRDGTLELVDLGAKVTVLQDFSATSDGALRIGAYQRPEEGSFCGPDIAQTAAYTWKLAGDVLTLKAKQDECADRDTILSGDWKER
jgi:outer membrane murein-binding lipoprotein Lpp